MVMKSTMYGVTGNAKRERYANPGWLKKLYTRAYTDDDVIRMIRMLEPKEFLDHLIRLQPREVKGEMTNVVRLLIEGVQAHPTLQKHESKPLELQEAMVEDDE